MGFAGLGDFFTGLVLPDIPAAAGALIFRAIYADAKAKA